MNKVMTQAELLLYELDLENQLRLLETAERNRCQVNTMKWLILNTYCDAPFAEVKKISYYRDRKVQRLRLSALPIFYIFRNLVSYTQYEYAIL